MSAEAPYVNECDPDHGLPPTTKKIYGEAALRALDEHCGDDLYTYVLGAAPVGVWDADADGYRREFVAKAIVVDPYASGPPACADYVWAAKDELGGYLADDAYLEFLRKLL